MSSSSPAAAVLNLPGLAVTLTSAGINVIGDGLADTKTTIDLLRTVQKNNQPFVIIAAIDDPTLRSWATLHASMGAPVLVARSEIFIRGDNIPQSRIIELPCTVNEIMANFGATLDAQYGGVEIGIDGRIVSDVPQSQPTGDPFNVFGTFTPPQTTQSPEVASITSAPSDDDVFAAPPPQVAPTVDAERSSDDDVFAKHVVPETTPDTRPNNVLDTDSDIDPTSVFEAEPDLPTPTPPARLFAPRPTPVIEAVLEPELPPVVAKEESEPVIDDVEIKSETPTPPTQYTDWLDAVNAEPEDGDFVEVIADEPEPVIKPEPEPEPPQSPAPARIFTPPFRVPDPIPVPLTGLTPPARRADLTDSIFTRTRPSAPTNERRAKVVAVFAGKGGVGKSTSMLSLAERAATVVPGLRVIAVDANRGQGDMRTFLKLDDAGLPSIYDAAVSRNPDVFRDVLINPKRLSASRVDRTPLHVGIILSPEKDQSDPSVVTSQVYARAIEYARTKADLVFIDTQIIESFDTSGLIDDVVVPLLLDGAWGLGLSDSSTPGVQNLMWVLNNFVERGVSTNRLMVALNKVAPDSLIDTDAMSKYVERYATWMGIATTDPLIERTLNLGEMPGSSGVGATPEFTALLDRVLSHVTGINAFSQISENPPPDEAQTAPSRRFMSRWRR